MALSNVAKVRDVAAEKRKQNIYDFTPRRPSQHSDEASEEEFNHAREISKYQTLRGGRVELAGVKKPATHEFAATEFKSDALVAFEAALEASLLLARFASADETSVMPPPHPPLSRSRSSKSGCTSHCLSSRSSPPT